MKSPVANITPFIPNGDLGAFVGSAKGCEDAGMAAADHEHVDFYRLGDIGASGMTGGVPSQSPSPQ